MAFNSRREYTGDGTTTDFLFDVPYIKEADVLATVEGSIVSITFVDSTHVRISPAPWNNSDIVIYRETSNTAATFTFPDLTYLKSTNLDGDFTQQLYLHQEVEDLLEINNVNNTVLIDGSRKMTGDLVLGDGTPSANSPALVLESTTTIGDSSKILMAVTDNGDTIGKIEAYDAASASLNLFAYPEGALTENSYDTQLSLQDGNARINGALGASTIPTLGDHLVNMTWVKNWLATNHYTQAEVDSGFVDTTGDTMTGALSINAVDPQVQLQRPDDLSNAICRFGQSADGLLGSGYVGVTTSSADVRLNSYHGDVRLQANNSAGILAFSGTGQVSATGTSPTPTLDEHLTRKDYVDDNFEASLGNPATNDQVLSSKTDGTRSWVDTDVITYIPLGTWNMQSVATLSKAHGLTRSKIRSVTAYIVNNGDTISYDYMRSAHLATTDHGIAWTATDVVLTRGTGCFFDNAAFNDGVTDRGWIVVRSIQ